jgi:hypothetical protein
MHHRLRSALRGAGLILALGAPLRAQSAGDWELVGAPGFSAGQAVCCQIIFDARGRPCIAYQDQTGYGGHTLVQCFESGSWSSVGTPGQASLGTAWYDRLRCDSRGDLFLASRDYQVGGALSVRRFASGASSWSSVGPNADSPAQAHYTALALDAAGVPYVAYCDRGATPREGPSVARYDASNGNWTYVGPRGITGYASGYNTLAFDSQGVLYTAFADRGQLDTLGAPKATVLRWDEPSSTWIPVGLPGCSPQGVANLVLAIDHQDQLYLAYYRYHDKLVVLRFDGTSWLQLGSSASGTDKPAVESEGWRQWLSLCFDSQDRPYIAYELFNGGLRAAVRRFDGASWNLVGSSGFTPDVADYLALAIDPADVPYVVFVDGSQARRVSVMRYAPSPCVFGAASPNSLGCSFEIEARGHASLGGTSAFQIQAVGVPSHRAGLLLWSETPAHVPFAGGAIYVAEPRHRTALQDSGGIPGALDCSGALSVDFDAILATGNTGLSAGKFGFAQFWQLDPSAPDGSALSAGLRFRIEP